MNAPTSPPFAPLPIRTRGALEIFDTGLKIFRRYFAVLVGWSALSALPWVIPIFGALIYFFTLPLAFGAAACVVAAAVRGQNVTFRQVSHFVRPRYSALLGVLLLGGLMLIGISIGLSVATATLSGIFSVLLNSLPSFLESTGTVVILLISVTLSSLLSSVALGWLNIGALISCLEDNHRGTPALGRAATLMMGNWKRVLGVCSALTIIISLVSTLLFALLVGVLGFWFYSLFSSSDAWDSAPRIIFFYQLVVGLLLTFWMPVQALVMAVLYLDLRVKAEALDLEWTNYATAPEPQNAPEALPVSNAPDGLPATEVSPASFAPPPSPSPSPSFEAPDPTFSSSLTLEKPAPPPSHEPPSPST